MAQQLINIGTVEGDGTGESLRSGGQKINENFTELYAGGIGGGMGGEFEEVFFDNETGTLDLSTATSDKVFFDPTNLQSPIIIKLFGVVKKGTQKQLLINTSYYDVKIQNSYTDEVGNEVIGLTDVYYLSLYGNIANSYIIDLISKGGGSWYVSGVKSNLQNYDYVINTWKSFNTSEELIFDKNEIYTQVTVLSDTELILNPANDHLNRNGFKKKYIVLSNTGEYDVTFGTGITLLSGVWDNRQGFENIIDLIYVGTSQVFAIITSKSVTDNTKFKGTTVGELTTDDIPDTTDNRYLTDTEIAKIHSQNTDNQLRSLDGGTIVSVEDLATIMDLTHPQNTDTILDDGGANEVSAAEIRGVVDFANIATPPAAYQIPVVQDITGVKSLKYSSNFVFENGTLKVKGAGNTTGKTLSIFNLAGTENVTVLDSGNVGIGTTDPPVKLSVVGAFAVTSVSYLNGGVYAPSYSSDLTNTLKFLMRAAPESEYARFTSLGHFGIGTTTPAMKLDVSQSTGQCFRLRYDGSTTYKADFTLDASGNLTIAPAGRTNITGDLNANGVLIDGTQVLSEQQAAIADATDNTTAISQLNLLLNAARAHGLIAT